MKTILQVDDDANDVFLLQHALRKVGVANPVQVASDGREAIDYLSGAGKFGDREKFPVPTLVLMDLKLPFVMGLDVLRWIRTQPGMPVIVVMLTASAEDADISEAYRLGANAFLTKPSEASKLEEMVKAIAAFWLTQNTLPPEVLPGSGRERSLNGAASDETFPGAQSLFRTAALGNHSKKDNGQVDADLSESFLHRPQTQGAQERSGNASSLTNRQERVLQLIAEGYSSREIASEFSLSIKTIEKDRQALMDKLNIHEVATLTRYAVSAGLVESSPGPGKRAGEIPAGKGR